MPEKLVGINLADCSDNKNTNGFVFRGWLSSIQPHSKFNNCVRMLEIALLIKGSRQQFVYFIDQEERSQNQSQKAAYEGIMFSRVIGLQPWMKDLAKKEIGKERSVCGSSNYRWQHGWTRSLEDVCHRVFTLQCHWRSVFSVI